jgi:hypothetical protein
MHLKYGPVDLAVEHTSEVSIRAVYDSSGLDYLYDEITVGVVCVFNPAAVATKSIPPFAAADRLGVTVNNLKHTLLIPRQQLQLTLGTDRTFTAPLDHPLRDAQGHPVLDGQGNQVVGPLPCDPGGGPFPEECRIMEVIGDKTAVVLYRIRFHTLDCTGNFVLSNRWRVSSDTDGVSYLTTRVIEGRAVLRADFALGQSPTVLIDQFRAAFVLSPPPGFIRKRVHVTATEDGRELVYQVIDREQRLNLGTKSPAVRVEGYATAGVDVPIGKAQALGTYALRAQAAAAGNRFLRGVIAGAWESLAGHVGQLIPTPKANCIVRVTGKAGVNYADLVKLAVQIALDRFANYQLNNTLFVVSAYITQALDNEQAPYVELRMEFLVTGFNVLTAILDPVANAVNFMNFKAEVEGPNNSLGGNALRLSGGHGNPPLPASNQTRGTWIGFLVSQALAVPCSVPAAPPAAPTDQSPDTRKEYLAAK